MRVFLLVGIVVVTSAAAAPSSPQAPPAIVDAYKVAVTPSGKLLVADGGGGAGRIFRIDPRTGSRSVYAGDGGRVFSLRTTARRSSLGHVTDVAVGPGGVVYAIASERVVRIDRRGRATVVARIPGAIGLALGRDAVYVTDVKKGRLLRVRSGQTEVIARGFPEPLVGVAVSPTGSVFVSSGSGNGRVESIATDGSRRLVFEGVALAAFITVAPDGTLLVVDHVRHEQSSPPGKLLRVCLDGTVRTLSEGKIRAPFSAVQTAAGVVYVTSFGTPAVGRLDPASGRLLAIVGR